MLNFTTFFSFLSLVLDLYGKFEQTGTRKLTNLKTDEMNNTLMNEKKVMYKYDDIGDSSALL